MLEALHLSKYFGSKKGTVKAVDDISFNVSSGEIYGLLGANGAGKTTTLRTLATMLAPTGGTAVIGGLDIVKDAERVRPTIGLLFGGDTGLYDRLTARENIVYFAELNGVAGAEAQKRAERFAHEFNFTEFLDKPAGKLSKGTRQKIAFSRSIIHDPAVMLFDEPTVGLDVTAKNDVQEFILRCKAEGKCILLSDHTLQTVERLCDRVGIMLEGKLLGDGTIAELCTRYGCINLEEVFFKLAGNRGMNS